MAHTDEDCGRVGVLVAQLGTPSAPTSKALRTFLAEFLSDPRVVDVNPVLWQLILRLFILPRRSARSAALYRNVWTEAGSPLLVHLRAQVEGLRQRLGHRYEIVLGMRYGEPDLAGAMQALTAAGIDRILVFPMFPQFSSSMTGSIYDAAARAANGRSCPLFFEHKRRMPALRYVPPYYGDPAYIGALSTVISEHVAAAERTPDRYLFSFHGIPQRYADEGDPYRHQCEVTARQLAAALELRKEQWVLGFQSRFGRGKWVQPYTGHVLERLGREGVGDVEAVCPGFTADCLETLDEIGRQGRNTFVEAGGQSLQLAPCLNAHSAWLDAMEHMVRRETAGWTE